MTYWLFRFDRVGSASYLSHLDTARALQRTFARAGIAIALSEGMRPKPRVSLSLPLPVGASATDELAVIAVGDDVDPVAALTALRAAAPRGIEPRAITPVATHPKPVAVAATYECTIDLAAATVSEALEWFVNEETAIIERVSPKGRKRLDLKEYIYQTWCRDEDGATRLGFTVRHTPQGAARPKEFIDLLATQAGVEVVMRALTRATVTYSGLPAV